MPERRLLFLVSSPQGLDHIAPLIDHCLDAGDRCVLMFDRPYDTAGDPRIGHLSRSKCFALLPTPGVRVAHRLARRAVWLYWNTVRWPALLRRERIQACLYEWSGGTPALAGWRRFVKPWLWPFRAGLMANARRRGIPNICLPHGLNIKTNIDGDPVTKKLIEEQGGFDFSERNSFDAYVFNTRHHRDLYVRYARMSPEVSAVWGSLRFAPSWMAKMAEFMPAASLPERPSGFARILFFLPKWDNRVNRPAALALLKAIAAIRNVQLVVRGHTKPHRDDPDAQALQALGPNVVDAGAQQSVSLIVASDAVVDVSSSIAVDAVLRRKPLVHPRYLHGNVTIFDSIGGGHLARDEAETVALVSAAADRSLAPRPEAEMAAFARAVVYGESAPFDVAAFHREQIGALIDSPPPRLRAFRLDPIAAK